MKVLNSILKEELERLIELRKKYEHDMSKFPKGSLIKKDIKGHIYYYLNYRDGEKKHYKYLGNLNKDELAKWNKNIKERRKLRQSHIQVKKDIKRMEIIVGRAAR